MAEAREVKPTWVNYGTNQVIENENLIAYFKLRALEEKYLHTLLGEFTSEGKYSLAGNIKKLLVSVKKNITEVLEDGYIAISEIKHLTLNFKVQFWRAEDQGVANLYFIENTEKGAIQSFVAQYIGIFDDEFLVRVKKVFNLESGVEEYINEASEELDKLIAEIERKRSEREYIIEMHSEFLVTDMMEALKNGGDKNKAIYRKILKEFEARKEAPSKNNMFRDLRLSLEKMIENAGGMSEIIAEAPEIVKIISAYSKQVREFDAINEKLDKMPEPYAKPNAKTAEKAKAKAARKLPKAGPIYKYKTTKPAVKKKPANKKDIMLKSEPLKLEDVPDVTEKKAETKILSPAIGAKLSDKQLTTEIGAFLAELPNPNESLILGDDNLNRIPLATENNTIEISLPLQV